MQQIPFYRAPDFALDEIAAMLADPDSTAADHLRRQHRLMREQIAHRQDLPAALEQEMRHAG
jgi:MerR family transcriptional regulator, thiopeptide resistance regulator